MDRTSMAHALETRSPFLDTAVVEFGATVNARSIVPFGQSMDPSSPHFLDQAPLYAAGELKPMWFTRRELEGHIERSYHPGAE